MKLVIANWKMNPETEREAVELAKKIDKGSPSTSSGTIVVVCPPTPFLAAVGEVLKRAKLGAQDVFYEEEGAYTGEVSPEQLKSLGVTYVLVGHSERRAMGETDEVVNKKVLAALKEGLTVILCVGEKERGDRKTKEQKNRETSLQEAKEFVKKQLEMAIKGVLPPQRRSQDDNGPQLIVAYEPVWAISSHSHGVSDTPEDAGEMITHIKNVLNSKFQIPNSKVLYGGSVNAGDVGGFLKQKEIDGVLVGSASLDAEEFGKIVKIARNSVK